MKISNKKIAPLAVLILVLSISPSAGIFAEDSGKKVGNDFHATDDNPSNNVDVAHSGVKNKLQDDKEKAVVQSLIIKSVKKENVGEMPITEQGSSTKSSTVNNDIYGSAHVFLQEDITKGRYQRINDVITSHVGVDAVEVYEDRPGLRGGSVFESLFIIDGISQRDVFNYAYGPSNYRVNLDAIEEIRIETGGISAKYGDLSSGIIHVTTKEGGQNYSGSINVQYSQPGLKHFGPMMYGHDSPVSIPFVDPLAGAFTGYLMNLDGTYVLDEEGKKIDNKFFEGWNDVANERLGPGDPHYGEPMEVYARWLWRHRSKDSIKELKRLKSEGKVNIQWGDGVNPDDEVLHEYGVEPDYRISTTFSGPVPFINRIRPTTFFLTYDREQIEYSSRFTDPVYSDYQFRSKVTTQVSDNIKLQIYGYFNKQQGSQRRCSYSGIVTYAPFEVPPENKLWYPSSFMAGEQTQGIYGFGVFHRLSEKTNYEIKYSHQRFRNKPLEELRNTSPVGIGGIPTSGSYGGVIHGRIGTETYADSMASASRSGWKSWKDWAKIKIGDYWYDESPKGYDPDNWRDVSGEYRLGFGNLINSDTYSISDDISAIMASGLNRFINLEFGFWIRNDKINQIYQQLIPAVGLLAHDQLTACELKGAVFFENTLESKGIKAKTGLRAEWIAQDDFPVLGGAVDDSISGPYTIYQLPGMTRDENNNYNTYDVIPTKKIKHLRWSPRLAVSYSLKPSISIFMNYARMYQWADVYDRYRLKYNTSRGDYIENWGNPLLNPLKITQHEIGYEHLNLLSCLDINITYYDRSMSDLAKEVRYYPIMMGGGFYRSYLNDGYKDTHGLELLIKLQHKKVPFISGWASYNYLVEKYGLKGYDRFFEDPSRGPREGTDETKADIRPVFRMSLNFHTPADFGPGLAGFSLLGGANMNLTYYWHRGEHFTWNPAYIPLVEDNLRWKAYQRFDLRFQKDLFKAGSFRSVFYIDVTNLFNNKNMTKPRIKGPSRGNPEVRTDDDWAWSGHKWWKWTFENYMYSLGYTAENQISESGEFKNTVGTPGDNKGDLPAFTPWTFLEKRDIYIGLRIYF